MPPKFGATWAGRARFGAKPLGQAQGMGKTWAECAQILGLKTTGGYRPSPIYSLAYIHFGAIYLQ